MANILDSVKTFAQKRMDDIQKYRDVEAGGARQSPLGFVERAYTPPPILPTGMQDSRQMMLQTNQAAGVQDSYRGGAALPSMQAPALQSQMSRVAPQPGALSEEDQEAALHMQELDDQRRTWEAVNSNRPPAPYSQTGYLQHLLEQK